MTYTSHTTTTCHVRMGASPWNRAMAGVRKLMLGNRICAPADIVQGAVALLSDDVRSRVRTLVDAEARPLRTDPIVVRDALLTLIETIVQRDEHRSPIDVGCRALRDQVCFWVSGPDMRPARDARQRSRLVACARLIERIGGALYAGTALDGSARVEAMFSYATNSPTS